MVNKNIKTSFTAETKSFEKGLKTMENLLVRMDKTLGLLSRTSSSTSSGVDKAFNQMGRTIKDTKEEMTGVEQVSKTLQDQLSKVGKMPQISNTNTLLDKFQDGMTDVSKETEKLNDKLSYVGEIPKVQTSISLLGRFVNGLNGVETSADSAGSGMGRFGDRAESMGISFGRVQTMAQTAFSRIGTTIENLSSVTARVVGDMTNRFSKGFNNISTKASNALNGVSEKFSRIGKGGNSLMGSVTRIAGAFSLFSIGQKAIGAVSNSLDGAINRFDTLKQFPKIMQSWGYSAEDAQKATDKMVKGIDGLPTKLDDITANVKTLVTSGLKLGEATDVALALNNAMLANGSSAEEAQNAMTQYSQMTALGKVDQQSWNSVVNAAGKALNDVAEELLGAGNGQADLYQALKDGDITLDTFNKKLVEMNNAVGGFAEQALIGSEGIKTSMTNIHTAISNGLEKVIRATDKYLEDKGLKNIAQSLDSLKKVIGNVATEIEKKVPAIMDRVLELGEVFKGLGVKGTLALMAIPTVLPTVLGALGTFGVGLGGLGTGFLKAPEKIGGAFGKLTGMLSNLKMPNLNLGSFGKLGELFTKIPGFDKVATGLGAITGKLGTFASVLGSVGSVTTSVLGAMGTAFLSMIGVALSAIAPTAILGAIIAGLGMVNEAFGEQINELLTKVTEKAPQVIEKFVDGIMEKLPDLMRSGSELIARFLTAINANLPAIFEGGMTLLVGLVQGVMSNLGILLPAVIKVIGTLAHGILTAIPDLILLGMEIIAGLVQGLVDNLPLIMDIGMRTTEEFIGKIMANLPRIIELGIEMLYNLIEGLKYYMPRAIEFSTRVIPELVRGIISMLPDIITAGVGIIIALIDVIMDNLPDIVMAGVEILVALVVGIIRALPEIVMAMIELYVTIQQTILDLIPLIFTLGWEIIKGLFTGIKDGIAGMGGEVIDSAKDWWGRMKSRFSKGGEETKDATLEQTGLMVDGISEDLYTVEQNAGLHGERLRGGMSGTWSGVERDVSFRTGNIKENTLVDFENTRLGAEEKSSIMRGNLGSNFGGMETDLGNYTSNISNRTVGDFESARIGVGTEVSGMYGSVSQGYADIATEASKSGTTVSNETDLGFKQATQKQQLHLNQMIASVRGFSKDIKATIDVTMRLFIKAIGDGMNLARGIMRSQTSGMVIILRSMYSSFYNAGGYAMAGLQLGLMSRRGNVLATANNIANSVAGTIRRALRIHSPSRVMEELGSYTGEGFDDGLSSWITRIVKTSGEFADAVMFGADLEDMANTFLNSVIETQYQVTGAVDNQITGAVEFYDNEGGAPQPLDLTISTPVGDWKLFVEDITEEQNAQIRRGRY